MDKCIFNVASYKRENQLYHTIQSIYDQADEINIAFNAPTDNPIPNWLLNDLKIHITFTDNSKGDAFKFMNVDKSRGYYFTIDDDIIYPPDYKDKMIRILKEHNNKIIVTYHGRSFKNIPINSYYRDSLSLYCRFEKDVLEDHLVQFGGTGVMCMHTDIINFDMNYFQYPNMTDVYIGIYAYKNNIPILCLAHSRDYIIEQVTKTSIYKIYERSDKIQTELINRNMVIEF